jgi:hypothetical protein
MSYIGQAGKLSQRAYSKVDFLAEAGQTIKTGLSYVAGFVEVYQNGFLLTNNIDYTATNGNSVTFVVPLILDDEITVVSLKTFSVANTYTQTDADALFTGDQTKADIDALGVTASSVHIHEAATVLSSTSTSSTVSVPLPDSAYVGYWDWYAGRPQIFELGAVLDVTVDGSVYEFTITSAGAYVITFDSSPAYGGTPSSLSVTAAATDVVLSGNLDAGVEYYTDTGYFFTGDGTDTYSFGTTTIPTFVNRRYTPLVTGMDAAGLLIDPIKGILVGTPFATITEGGNTGYGTQFRADNPDNYGDIGYNAIDLSYNAYAFTGGATGEMSFASGGYTTASGSYSTALGSGATASGSRSTAIGFYASAVGMYSTAMGFITTAADDMSTVIGKNGGIGTTSGTIFGVAYGASNPGDITAATEDTNLVFKVSDTGIVSAPNQPSFHALLTTNQDLLSAVTLVGFTTELLDNGNNLSGGVFTAPVSGIYQINLTLSYVNGKDSSDDTAYYGVYKNGAAYAEHVYNPIRWSNVGVENVAALSAVVSLSAGDTCDIRSHGITQTPSPYLVAGYCHFSGHLIG